MITQLRKVLLICAFIFNFPAGVYAESFYAVTDKSKSMTWLHKKDLRDQHIDSRLSKISPELKSRLLSFDGGNIFEISKGDVGLLVKSGLLDHKGNPDLVILDVEGHPILISSNGVKQVGSTDLLAFKNIISDRLKENYGFRLGKTTFEEASDILQKQGAKFDAGLSYKGFTDIPMIVVNEYSLMPVIKGVKPQNMTLHFVDNTLYEVSIYWNKGSIYSQTYLALINKYNRNFDHGFSGLAYGLSFWEKWMWVNNNKHIRIRSYHAGKQDKGFVLSYVATRLAEQGDEKKVEIDRAIADKKRKNKRAAIESQL